MGSPTGCNSCGPDQDPVTPAARHAAPGIGPGRHFPVGRAATQGRHEPASPIGCTSPPVARRPPAALPLLDSTPATPPNYVIHERQDTP